MSQTVPVSQLFGIVSCLLTFRRTTNDKFNNMCHVPWLENCHALHAADLFPLISLYVCTSSPLIHAEQIFCKLRDLCADTSSKIAILRSYCMHFHCPVWVIALGLVRIDQYDLPDENARKSGKNFQPAPGTCPGSLFSKNYFASVRAYVGTTSL